MKLEIQNYRGRTNKRLLARILLSGKSLGAISKELGFSSASRLSQILHNTIPASYEVQKKIANYFKVEVGDIFD